MSKKSRAITDYPPFLKDLLIAKSPTGHEFAAQAVIDAYVEKSADTYAKDAIGNRIATLKGNGGPTLMFAGHIDEIGLIVSHVDDKGYLYFEFLGGHDQIIPSGRRLHILTRNGPVLGITGKRAVHLLSPEDRKRVPERHDMWIDIGVNNRADALTIVRIGDPAYYWLFCLAVQKKIIWMRQESFLKITLLVLREMVVIEIMELLNGMIRNITSFQYMGSSMIMMCVEKLATI